MAINPNKVVSWFRENEPGLQDRSDYDVYEYAKGAFPQYKKELEEVGNPFDPSPMQPIITEKSEVEADYSPQKFEGLTSWMNVADSYADEGMPSLGINPEFFKKAYNESLAGMTYAIGNGKFKYDIGDYEPTMMEEVFQFVVGTLNPIDAIAFFGLPIGGAKIGTNLAQKQLAKWGTKAVADGARKKVVQNNLKSSIFEGVLQTGLGFGAYSAAAGAISSASQQATSPETDGKIDKWKVAKDATAAGLEGIAMGAIAGGASKGIGNRYAKWEVANKGATNLQKKTKKTLNVLGQIGVEAGAFTAVPYFIHGVPKDEDGTIGWEQVGKQLVADFALDAIIRSATGDIFRQANQDLQQYSKALGREVKSKIDNNDQLSNSIRNVVGDSPESASIFRETQAEELNKIIGIKDGVDKLLEDTKRALEISNKPESELTNADKVELVSYIKSMNEIKGLYIETLEQPELQRALGIELMSPQTEAILKAQVKAIDNASKTINKLERAKVEPIKTDADAKKDADVGTDIPRRKDLSEMTDTELIDEAARIKGRTQEDLRKEYTEDKLDIMKGKKIPTLNRERLMNLLVEPVDVPKTLSNEDFISASAKDIGIAGKDKNKRKVEMDKVSQKVEDEVFEGGSNQTQNFNTSKAFIENLVRNTFPNRKGGGGGRGEKFIELPSMLSEVDDYFDFAKHLAEKGKNFLTMTADDVNSFVSGKPKTVANSLNYMLRRVESINPNVKGMQAGELVSMAGEITAAEKGVRLENLGEGDFVEFVPSKAGGDTRKIPISPELKKSMQDLIDVNKKLGKSFEFTDIDGIKHNFSFWTKEGNVVTGAEFDYFLDKLDFKGAIGRKINKKMFRKSFASWVKGRGVDPQVMKLVDEMGLTHSAKKKKGELIDRYAEVSEAQQKEYVELLNEFVNEIFGDTPLDVKRGTKNSLSTYELRKAIEYVRQQDEIGTPLTKAGKKRKDHKSMTPKDFETLLRYYMETSARSTDILPTKKYLDFIDFKKPKAKPKPTPKIVEKFKAKQEGKPAPNVKKLEYIKEENKGKLKELKRLHAEQIKLSPNRKTSAMRVVDKKIAMREAKIKEIDKKLSQVKKRTTFQRGKGEEVFKGKDVEVQRQQFIDKVLKKNNLTREQIKVANLDANTLGEFANGIIKLQKGEFQPADFYHENLHRLKAFANKTNNKSLSNLIDKAEGLGRTAKEFKEWKKNNPTRDMEEFLADVVGGKASRIEFTRGMIPKLNQFIKQIVSKVKSALGVANFNDYARILARQTQKGFDTKGVKFDATVKKREIDIVSKDLAKKVRENFDLLVEKIFKTSDDKEARAIAKGLLPSFASQAGIEDAYKPNRITRANLSKLKPQELNDLLSVINESDIQKLRARKNLVKWMDTYRGVENFRLKANVSKKNQKFFLEQLGVKDGDITKANIKTLKEYKILLKDLGFKAGKNNTWIDEAFNLDMIDDTQASLLERFDSLKFEGAKLFAPVESAVRSLGKPGEKIANQLFNHASQEARYVGDLVDAEGRMANHLGGERQFNKVKDFFYLMDRERRIERQEKGLLTDKEKSFISKAFNEDGSFADSGEGRALSELSEFNKSIKNNFLDALKQIMNDAEYEDWISKNNIKWLDSREYIHRGLSDDFSKSFSINSASTRKLVRKEANEIAIKIVEQRNPGITGDAKKKAIDAVDSEALDIARQNIINRGNYMQTSISSRFLQSRISKKLDEKVYSEKLRKDIDVYETSYDSTVRKYALGMSKFNSSVEFFPEYVKIKGYKSTANFKTGIQKLSEIEGGTKARKYLSKIVEKQLGVHESDVGTPKSERFLNDYASIIAKTQLSFPTSGLKNALVGNYQTLGAFRIRDFFRGVLDSFDSDLRREMRKTGQTELGLRNIDNQVTIFGSGSKSINSVLDTIFKGGFMRPTENMNRYIAVRAAKAEQGRLVGHLMAKPTTRKYKNAVTRFKEFYRLTDNEVAMLKDYGMGGADGLKAGIEAAKVSRKMNQIYQKMDTAAHIYTQGSTLDLFMPEIFGAQFAKPITLYKRMAYAALSNTLRNTKIAYKTNNLLRPLMLGAGAYLSGQAMMGVYNSILGQQPPQENGDFWDNLVTTLWKGEFGGIMSEFMNPTNSEGFMTTPAIYNHASMVIKNIMEVTQEKATVSQSFDASLKTSIGAYNQLRKIYDNKDLTSLEKSYNGKFKKYRKLHQEFSKELKDSKVSISITKDERTPYFKDFLKSFNVGTEKEFARQYVLTFAAIANDYYQEGYDTFGKRIRSMDEAFKEAQKAMDRKMKLLNPNKAKYMSRDKIAKRRAERFLMDYLNKDQRKELRALENEYNFKIRSFNKNKNKYFKDLNVAELISSRIK